MTSYANPGIMFDGIKWAGLPAKAPIVGGYVNGIYEWPAAGWARFPGAAKVRIDVNGRAPTLASVLDVERYDATVADAPRWLGLRSGFRPGTGTIYCNRSTLPALLAATEGFSFWLWLAAYTNQPAAPLALGLPARVTLAACQYANLPQWDESAVYSGTWLAQHAA